jgi:CHAD domain-containing protein
MPPHTSLPAGPKSSRESEQPVTVAYRHIVRSQAAKLHERAADVRAGTGVEEIHRLRVTLRRIRSAFRLMRPFFKPRQLQPLRDGASVLAERLGAVRDLDVALMHLDNYMNALPPERHAGLVPLVRDWQLRRQRAYWDLLGLLNGEDYRVWMALLMEFTQQSVDKDVPRVCDVLPKAIWKQYAAMRAFEPRLADASLPVLHALRIEAKRMRYILEFFEDALGADGKAVVAALTVFQDTLGHLHDSGAIYALVASSPDGDELTTYCRALSEEEERLRSESLKTFNLVAGQPFRVLLGLAVANL